MAKDLTYTNGVIAVKETFLLKDKVFKLCEGGAEEAFRALQESGFGKGAEVNSVYEYEKLLQADEKDLDEFIRKYAPTQAEAAYLLAPRDFHNAKAAVKAQYLGVDGGKMLAEDGLILSAEIVRAVKEGDFDALGGELGGAVKEALELVSEEDGVKKDVSGALTGIIFDKALYSRLLKACAKNSFLKKLVSAKADMTNILTALRSQTPEYAASFYVCGGKLSQEKLEEIFEEDGEKAASALNGTGYEKFYKTCLEAKASGAPLTEAEKMLDSLETDLLSQRKYDLKGKQPFLYYVFRRRAENANVRILFVCLLSGMKEQDIKRRLRTV